MIGKALAVLAFMLVLGLTMAAIGFMTDDEA